MTYINSEPLNDADSDGLAAVTATTVRGSTPAGVALSATVSTQGSLAASWRSFLVTAASRGKAVFGLTAVLATLDILLLERKYNLFSGGFLQTSHIAGAVERAVFVLALFSLEFALAFFVWSIFLLIGLYSKTPSSLIRYQFITIYGGLAITAIFAKYKVLTYFGDFVSLGVLRNLGGGSASHAILYALEEGLVGIVASMFFILAGFYLYRRKKAAAVASAEAPPALSQAHNIRNGLVSIFGLLALSIAVRSDPTMSRPLLKVTPFALAEDMISGLVNPGQSTLVRMKNSLPAVKPDPEDYVAFSGRKDNLIFIISESTRADTLEAMVGDKYVTPNWRLLAAEGSAAKNYFSHTGFTMSSLKAIFRGSLGTDLPFGGTLFEVLKNNGYQVVVISGQDESFGNIAQDTKSEQVADIFFDARKAVADRIFPSKEPASLKLSNGRVVKQFDKITSQIDWSRPVFMYINLQSAHFPYYHPDMPKVVDKTPLERSEISEARRHELLETYYNAVGYSDWATGEIVARLKALGVYKKSLVAVAGDHGESLFDDGVLGHGIKITDSQLNALLVTNRPMSSMNGLIGQTDLAEILLSGIGATVRLSTELPSSLLQIIGDANDPVELGYVYKDGARFTVDNVNEEINASWLQHPVPIAQLDPSGKEAAELRRLVIEWKKTYSPPSTSVAASAVQ